MTQKTLTILSILVILLPVVACSQLMPERMPGIDLPWRDMNREMQLSAPPQINTFKMGGNLALVLVNTSDSIVKLPPDYGVHIYRHVVDRWEIVENRIDNPPGDIEVYPRDNEPFREVVVLAHPMVFSDQPVSIRIVVVGNDYIVANGKTGEQRGAFIDVTLEPK
jgi:hypothetical protein